MRWVLARVAQRIREAIAQANTAEEKVSAMIDAIFVSPESNRRFYLVFFDFLGYAARSDRFADVSATFHEIMRPESRRRHDFTSRRKRTRRNYLPNSLKIHSEFIAN